MLTIHKYARDKVVNYAQKYSTQRNPDFFDYSNNGGNCTNFASQCLLAGAPIMNFNKNGWFYVSPSNTSYSWANVEPLYNFIINNKDVGIFGKESHLEMCEIGDIIQLKFKNKQMYSHCLVVTKIVSANPKNIFICANSRDVKNVPLSYYSYEKMRLIHILGFRK